MHFQLPYWNAAAGAEGGLDMNKINFKSSSTVTNILFAVLLVALTVAVVLINMVAKKLSDKYPLSVDLTSNSAYKIGDDTKSILDSLATDIDIVVLSPENKFTGSSYLVQLKHIIDEYPKYSDKVSVTYVDVSTDPTFSSKYPNLELSEGDTLVTSTFGIKQLPLSNMFTYTYTGSDNSGLTVNGCRGEEAITSAIAGVLTADYVKVGFLIGNGAGSDMSSFSSVLYNNNYEVKEINMITDSFEDRDIIILSAPTTDIDESILKKFDNFLYNGGDFGKTLLYCADTTQPKLENLEAFLREWGVEVKSGAVFETSSDNVYSYQPYYPYASYEKSEYIEDMKNLSNPFLAPMSRPLKTVYDYRDNRKVSALVSFKETAGIRPENAPDTFTAAQADEWGPFPAVVISKWNTGKSDNSSQVVVSASKAAFGATAIGNSSFSNGEFIVNLFNKLTNRENTIAIETKSLSGNVLAINTATATRLGIILCILIPVFILGTGITVSLKRRYK